MERIDRRYTHKGSQPASEQVRDHPIYFHAELEEREVLLAAISEVGEDRFVYATDFLGPDAIYVARPDGTQRRRLVLQKALSAEDPGGLAANPAFAPSGSQIVLTFNEDLYTMNAQGRNKRRVTRGGGDEADWARAS